MKWYEGSIPSAIQEAKSRNAVFVVYITGLDDSSKKMDETWKDSAVAAECHNEKMVVIRVDAQSETCTQFSAIYPVVCVPSVFFIGNSGVPLEITGGQKSPEEFVKILRTVSQTHRGGTQPAQPEAVKPPDLGASGYSAEVERAETVPAAGEPQPSSSRTVDDVSKEEKLKRAQELIEQKRIAKAEEEKEKEKLKELERRQLGHEMKKLQDWKEDKKLKETQDQLKREKEEDRKARERVKEQIARDRAERAAKYQKDKAEKDKAQQEKEEAKLAAKQDAMARETARKSEFSRVQFRLADGSFVTQQFSSSDPLQNARQFIAQHMGRPSNSLSLSTTYPRRLFNDGDMGQNFANLGLAPSAVIMVLPSSSRSASSTGGGNSQGFLGLLLTPFLYIWALICSIFIGRSQPSVRVTPTATEPQPGTSQASGGSSDTGSAYQRKQQPRNLRQEGNIHRLTDDHGNKDDEDMGTWNGNSTQQM
ncbi:UBX domain-containing protein 4-like [Lineus longissimus]|uniref:UBX domain-containing protein 4-like n=1 Tax=Lineus longissimus TaxID=88925 RepID=UPI002B4F7CFF